MDDEKLYIWDDFPVYGYGVFMSLIVKAIDAQQAFVRAKKILKDSNYKLPEGVESIDAVFMIVGKPDVYYLSRFEGKLLVQYE